MGHQNGGGAVAAADIGDVDAGVQPVRDAVECRDPVLYEVARVARTEQPHGSVEQVVGVLVPAEPSTAADHFVQRLLVLVRRGQHLRHPHEERRTLTVGEHGRILVGQGERVAVRVVAEVSADELLRQPLSDVALLGVGALGELRRCRRACSSECTVEAESVTEANHADRERAGEIGHHLSERLLELGLVDGHISS